MQYRPRRETSDITVRVTLDDDEQVVDVRNVTASGLQLRGAFEAEVGDPALILFRDRRFRGKIVWLKEDAAGIVFDEPLRPADLAVFTGRRMRETTRPGQFGRHAPSGSLRR